MASEQLASFRQSLKRLKATQVLYRCLKFTHAYPQFISEVGVAWVDKDKFIMSTTVFNVFTGIKVNTINKNLKEHGFTNQKLSQNMLKKYSKGINFCPFDRMKWSIRSCEGFSFDSNEYDLLLLNYNKKEEENENYFSDLDDDIKSEKPVADIKESKPNVKNDFNINYIMKDDSSLERMICEYEYLGGMCDQF